MGAGIVAHTRAHLPLPVGVAETITPTATSAAKSAVITVLAVVVTDVIHLRNTVTATVAIMAVIAMDPVVANGRLAVAPTLK